MEVVIIGGIAAGMSIAAKAKRVNRKSNVTVIEKENYVSFGACGLPYYLGGQFDDGNMMMVRSPEQIRDAGINLLLEHEAIDIDFDKKTVKVKDLTSGEIISKDYDRLAIATGAMPIIPKVEGVNSQNVYTITRLNQVTEFKEKLEDYKNIVVIGGGFIGVETAEQLAHLGKNVSLVNRSGYLMRKAFDPEFSDKIRMGLEEDGVKVLVNRQLEGFTVEGSKVTKVVTQEEILEADAVVLALGFKPNTAFISDEIEKLANGALVIDEYGRTSIEDVYSAGDCATVENKLMGTVYSPLATYANKMGRLIGENIVSSEDKAYIKGLGSSMIKAGNYGAGVTGLTEKAAKDIGLDYKTSFVKTKNHAGYWPKNQADIFIKLVYDKKTRVILGGQIFGGQGAVERIHALSVAVYKELTVDELGFMDFAYAPPFASTWDALNVAGNASK